MATDFVSNDDSGPQVLGLNAQGAFISATPAVPAGAHGLAVAQADFSAIYHATDLATAQTLVNAIADALVAAGWISALHA